MTVREARARAARCVRGPRRGASALACLVGAHLLWNWTASLPLGLYWLSPSGAEGVAAGTLVAFPVPASVRALVRERRYLPPGALLVKPVVATRADRVCTDGGTLTVNGAPLGAMQDRGHAREAACPTTSAAAPCPRARSSSHRTWRRASTRAASAPCRSLPSEER